MSVVALGISVILFLGIIMKPLRGQPTLVDDDITVVIQSSRKDKSTEVVLDRSYLGLNERLYQRNNTVVVTDSLSAYLLLSDLTPAVEYHDKPVSRSQMEQNEVILAEGNFVDVNLRQGTRTPESFSEMIRSMSWIKSSDSDSVLGFELFHIGAYIKSGIQESHVALVPTIRNIAIESISNAPSTTSILRRGSYADAIPASLTSCSDRFRSPNRGLMSGR